MIHRLFIFLLLSVVYSANALSQNSRVKRELHFNSINQVALLTGSAGQAAGIQSINGITVAKWFTGIGIGIDYYGTRSIPLFVDIRRDLNANKKSPFVYADAGISIPWISNDQKSRRPYSGSSTKGFYLDAGAGFKFRLKNDNALLLSAGYSYKEVKDKTELMTIWIWPTPAQNYEYYRYQYRRIVVKIAVEF